VPDDAFFDLIGQVVEENNQSMNATNMTMVRCQINNTMNYTLGHMESLMNMGAEGNGPKGFDEKTVRRGKRECCGGIFKDFIQLYADKRYRST